MPVAHPRLALVLLVSLLVAYEGYAFFVKTEGESAFLPAGEAVHLTREIGPDGPLELKFIMRADGLEAISLWARPSDAPPEGVIAFTLLEQLYGSDLPADRVLVLRAEAPVAALVASPPYRLVLPRIDRSAGSRYVLQMAVSGARPGHGPRFEAGWPSYADARMQIGGREEWGDLKFRADAQRTTIFRNVAQLRRSAPAAVARSGTFWIALLGLFTWALAVLVRDLAIAPRAAVTVPTPAAVPTPAPAATSASVSVPAPAGGAASGHASGGGAADEGAADE